MTLTLLRIDDPRGAVEATELPVVIGRGENVQVHVKCRWASRRHCEIVQIDGDFVLRDLGSSHGTIVNGQSIREIVLNPGDQIGVGLARFVVKWQSERGNIEHEFEMNSTANALRTSTR